MIVGGALSLSGAILQGIFRNPLVEPYTLGISGGASLGVVFIIVFSLEFMWGSLTLPLSGFLGALGTLILIYLIAMKKTLGTNQNLTFNRSDDLVSCPLP